MFLKNTYKNVSWITVFDSWKDWKNIWIIAITHGNEPVWIEIFDFLVNHFKISKKIKKWKIFLIANNISAYHKNVRFIDDNMNRISNQKFKNNSIEFSRFEELKPIFDEIDIVLDLHSVPIWDDVIWLSDVKFLKNAKNFFNVENILIDDMGQTWAIIGYFLRNNKEWYWLECGNHISSSWFEKWKENVLNFLKFFDFIDDIDLKIFYKNIFKFREEIIVKSDNFKFLKNFSWFTELLENEIFAFDNWEVKNNLWKNIFLAIPMKNPKEWTWAGFLVEKIN